MKTLRLIALIAAITALALPIFAADCSKTTTTPDNTLSAFEKSTGWQLLFDGKTLDGWGFTDPTPGGWIIENNSMFYTVKGSGYAYTKKTFGNYQFKCDFMVDKGSNSGVFFRWENLNDPVETGFEMQVYDTADKTTMSKNDSGALYDAVAPSVNAMKPAMQWNTAEITCKDSMIIITMNDKRIVVANLDRWTVAGQNPDGTPNKYKRPLKDWARSGHIGFQAHGGKVWYKNIKIREL
ncbi:MAG: DUF1080 domain-containing protein [Armatimonadetes bacterium]|nr:DUF1080 domain-containing protein [Armatimonadota bacterium]